MRITKLLTAATMAVALIGAGHVEAQTTPDSPDEPTGEPGDSPDDVPADEDEGTTAGTGIGIAPAFLFLDDTLRGNAYTDTINLLNGLPGDREFSLTPGGDIAEWLSFTDGDEVPIDSIVIPQESSIPVQINIEVPADVPNGSYQGAVEVASVLADDTVDAEGSGADVSIGAVIPITITVGGDMRQAGSFDNVRASSAEVGIAVELAATFNNTGNVSFRPAIEYTISRGDQIVESISVPPENSIAPGRAEDVLTYWDTTDTLPGDYSVLALATAEGYEFEPIDVPFRIEQPGSIERSGSLEALVLVNEPESGGVARLRGTFRNESAVPVSALLVAEVSRDGTLIGEARSLEILAVPGNVTNFDLIVEDIENGDYVVVGKVNFEGRETDSLEVAFTVPAAAAAATVDSGDDRSDLLLVAILFGAGVGIVILAVLAVLFVRRRIEAASGDAKRTPQKVTASSR
jgi:hypothetical protein